MALSDTAEYWHDVKISRKEPYPFQHLPNVECGHYHKYEARYLEEVDCFACLELLKAGITHTLSNKPGRVEIKENKQEVVQLNLSQTIAVDNLTSWFYASNSPKVAVLEAPAGFGKSFTVKYFLNKLGRFASPLCTAPFNEATYQLRQALAGTSYPCKTTYSAFNFAQVGSEDTVTFKQVSSPELDAYNLIVVDEIGTLSGDLLEVIENTPNIKILGLGHRSQLPPIVKNLKRLDKCISPVFTRGYPIFTLTEPMRNKGEIYEYCQKLDKLITSAGIPPTTFNKSKSFVNNYIGNNAQDFFAGTAKVLAYTNAQVDTWNKTIRESIFGSEAADNFLVGDKIVFTNPAIGYPRKLITAHKWYDVIGKDTIRENIFTNTKAVVKAVGVKEVLNVMCYELAISTDSVDSNNNLFIHVPIVYEDYIALRDKYYRNALYCKDVTNRKRAWKDYHTLQNLFAQVKHSYAMTVHRSQGSSIQKVISDSADISKCTCLDVRKKLEYVAASRAVHELYVLV